MNTRDHTVSITLHQTLLIAGIILIAFNLRPAITSVGPLLGIIRDDIGLSNWSAGVITSLPLLAFAVMSPIAPKLGNRFGNERTLLLGLFILCLGIGIRSIAFTLTLYTGTALVGLGIAICNVLLPGVIKEKFPEKIGLMTSIYSTSMASFAALASGLSIPLTERLGGWQQSLASWAALSAIGLFLWLGIMLKNGRHSTPQLFQSSAKGLLRSPLAWQVTFFMGFQSFLFYSTISWLPEILHEFGLTIETAGWLLAYMQFISLPATFIAPILAGKFKNQQGMVLLIGLCALIGYGGILIGGPLPLIVIYTTLIGFALGASISLALAFLSMRAVNARQAAELSGMAQSFGYLLAATGPMLIGFLYDFSHQWTLPLLVFLIGSLLVTMFGVGAGRDKYVLESRG